MKQLNNISAIESFRVDLRLFERAIDRINKSACSIGINVPQCHTIMEIGLADTLSVNSLAEKMDLDKSTVSRQVEKLVKSEVVVRITSPEDRRKVNISLSPKGKEIYQIINSAMNEQFEKAFQKVSSKELSIFFKVFSLLAKSL